MKNRPVSSLVLFLLLLFCFTSLVPLLPASGASTEEEEAWLKINPIGKPPTLKKTRYDSLAERLGDVGSGRLDPLAFYNSLGADGMSLPDLAAFKGDYINSKASELAKQTGKPPLSCMTDALAEWNAAFGRAERTVLDVRRRNVQTAFDRAVARYAEAHPDFPYLIKMDVGSWASGNYRDLRFEGDIDFSVIASMVENAVELRNLYNQEIRKIFGMDMADLEAHATAQRKATSDVYITQASADWAEMDALKRGLLQEISIENGQVKYIPVTDPLTRSFIFANLKNNLQMKAGGEDQLARLMDEPLDRVRDGLEPSMSLELLRHLNTDALRSTLSYHEKLIKIAKFVERSSALQSGPPADPALASWAKAVTELAGNKGLPPAERLKRILRGSSAFLGNPGDMPALERAVRAAGERAEVLLRENVSRGLDRRMKTIDDTESPEKKKGEQEKLLGELEEIHKAYGEKGVDFPPKAAETMETLAAALKRETLRIPPAEMERMREFLEKTAENPKSFEMALSMVWKKASSYYETADAALDSFNNVVDYLDNNTVAHLRALNTELRFGSTEGKFRLTIPLPIGKINDRLNATVLGKIGNSLPFKGFNLGTEALGYWDAVAGGKDWNESFSNLGTQIFRSRVPGGDIVEAVVMENYTRAAIGVVYILFPTAAIPEALYGMSVAAAEWSVGQWQQWLYSEMVDALYEGTEFEREGDRWRVTSITYANPGRKPVPVTREEIFTLPEKAPAISNILLPQVSKAPSVTMYHELLLNTAISDGQADIPVWPRRYKNLSLYGEKLWKNYEGEVKKVTRQYFAEVLKELEKRKEFLSGAGMEKLREIEKELGCGKPILELTGDAARDRPAMEEVLENWNRWKEAHEELMALREKWKAFFILVRKPSCSAPSIEINREEDERELAAVRQALAEARRGVEEIVGREKADYKTVQPAARARIGAVIYPSGSPQRREMIDEYREYLDSLRGKQSPLLLRIVGPETVEAGRTAEFTALLDREVRSVRYDWGFASGGDAEVLEGGKTARITWSPAEPGVKKLEVHALADIPGTDWVRAVHTVTVLTPEEAPKAQLRLTAPVKVLNAGERVPLTAETVRLGLGGAGFSRYFWFVNGRPVSASAENVFVFDGVGYEGEIVTLKVEGRSENSIASDSSLRLAVEPSRGNEKDLKVLIAPDVSEIAAGSSLRLRGIVLPRSGEGKLEYQWSVNGEPVGDKNDKNTLLFDSTGRKEGSVEISLYARQVTEGDFILYEGQAVRKIALVKDAPISLALAPYPRKTDDATDIKICVSDPRDEVTYSWYEWNVGGKRWSVNTTAVGRCMTKSPRGLSGQDLRFRVVAEDGKGRSATLDTDFIAVTDPQWEPAGEEEEQKEPEKKQEEKPVPEPEEKKSPAEKEGAEPPVETAETKGDVRLVAPARVMEGDILTVRAEIPPTMAEKAAPSYRWGQDGAAPIRPYALLNEDAGDDRTSAPEGQIQFLPNINFRGKTGSIGIFLYEKLKGNQKGLPMNSLAEGFASLEVQPMGCSFSADSSWAGGPNENGFTLLRSIKKDDPMKWKGEFLLEIGTWPQRTMEALEKEVEQNEPYGTKEAVSIDDYKGYMMVRTLLSRKFVSNQEAFVGSFSGSAVLKGRVLKGEVSIWFSASLNCTSPSDSQREEVQKEVDKALSALRAILASISVVPDPKRTTFESEKAGEKKEEGVVSLKRISPASGPVPVGAPLDLQASLGEGEKEKDVLFRFEPSTEVTFSPAESGEGRTRAVFSEPGKVGIWVSALREKGETLGESDRMEIEVVGPELTFSVTPKDGRVGQEIEAKALTKPSLPEGAFVVWNLKGKSRRQGALAADTTRFSFLAEEMGTYTAEAEVRSPKGETLAKGTVPLEIKGYDVAVTILGPAGPRPQEWAEGKGLQTIEKGTFLRDEHVKGKAEIKEKDAPKDLRWKWIPGEGTSLVSTGIGSEATLYGNAAGTASVKVEIRNAEGLLLGTGSASFPVAELPPGLASQPLKVSITPEKADIAVNGSVIFTALPEGGKPPYRYEWSGEAKGSAEMITLVADSPGKKILTVTVTDALKKIERATLSVDVKPFSLTITGLPGRASLGESLSCRVDYPLSPPGSGVNRNPVPQIRLAGDPVILWNPSSGTGPGFSGRAVQPGEASVWAEARNRKGEILGTSEKITVSVAVPNLSLTLPETVQPGKFFRASVDLPKETGGKNLLTFQWKDSLRTDMRWGSEEGWENLGPVYGLDPVSVYVLVEGKQGTFRTELEGTVRVEPLKADIQVGKVSGVEKIVHPDGRVDYPAEGEWMEGQTLALKAVPVVRNDGAAWEWALDGGGSLESGITPDAHVTLPAPGKVSVTAVMKLGGKEAGRGILELPVPHSAKKGEAAREFLTAQNAEKSRSFESAVGSMEKASALDPENPAIARELARMKGELDRARADSKREKALELWKAAGELQKEKKYEESIGKYHEGLELFREPSVEEHVKKLEAFLASLRKKEAEEAAGRERAEALWKQAAALQVAKEYQGAIEKYRAGLALSSDAKVEDHVRKLEEFLARQQRQEALERAEKERIERERKAALERAAREKAEAARKAELDRAAREKAVREKAILEKKEADRAAAEKEKAQKDAESAGKKSDPAWGGWKEFTVAGIAFEIPSTGFESVKKSTGTENGKYPYLNFDFYVKGKRVAVIRVGTLRPGLKDGDIKSFYTGKSSNRIFDTLTGEGSATVGGRRAYFLEGTAPGITRKFSFVSDGGEGGLGAYLHVLAGQGSGWTKYRPLFDQVASKMRFGSGSKGGESLKKPAEPEKSAPSGWKTVSIGSVKFSVPSSWKSETMQEHDVDRLNLFFEGSVDSPSLGVSGGVLKDYAKAKKDMKGARQITLNGIKIFRSDEGPAISLLFPPVNGGRAVGIILFRGKGGKKETLDKVLNSISLK